MRLRGGTSAALLAAPLLLFLILCFALPLGWLLAQAVRDDALAPALPRTLAALRDWDGKDLPEEPAFAALATDLGEARQDGTLGRAAARLNDEIAGLHGTLLATARALDQPHQGSARDILRNADPAWGRLDSWMAIRRAAGPFTSARLLASLDLRRDDAGKLHRMPPDQAVFRLVLRRTLATAGLVTGLCLLAGFPLAGLLAGLPPRRAGWLLVLVLLPLWSGVLVRTASWMVLLARDGLVNRALIALHLRDQPLPLLYGGFAVTLAMVHILLPFMILPLYAAMRQIPPSQLRAAASLGAGPVRGFLRVWLPQTAPGIGAGGLLVFIQALGFYVTPALLGGGADQMLPWFITYYANESADRGMAAALSVLLLAVVGMLAAAWVRLVGLGAARPA